MRRRVATLSEQTSIEFAKPDFDYDELDSQLKAKVPSPKKSPHDVSAVVCIKEANALDASSGMSLSLAA